MVECSNDCDDVFDNDDDCGIFGDIKEFGGNVLKQSDFLISLSLSSIKLMCLRRDFANLFVPCFF